MNINANLKYREKMLFLIVMILITSLGIFILIINPAIEKNNSLKDLIYAKQLKLIKYQNDINKHGKFKEESKKINQLSKPNESEEVDKAKLLSIIDAVQQKSGVEVINLSPLPAETSIFKRLLVKIELEDSMANIIRFMMELRNVPEKLSIVNLRVVPGTTGKDNLRASLTVAQLMALK